ncbi:MAG: LytR/AlgR family response regulator transcription factor [Melioribacter sp.]|uniref:LytR/AlgR family response regulator transcription factor n=1 Tax=Melioribacter sp. TaxID=2052167 RepID=UPI003BBFC6C0
MKTILIIEDDSLIRTNLQYLLNKGNYKLLIASNGEEGINIAKQDRPDLIICDILMPGIDGFEVKRRLEEDENTAFIPFIFLTAKADYEDLRKGMNLGADDYIYKPFKAADLLSTIELRLAKYETLKKFNGGGKNGNKFSYEDSLFIESGNTPVLIKIKEIALIESENSGTNLFLTGGRKYYTNKLVKAWEGFLPASHFLRIRKSIIINTNFIDQVEKINYRKYFVLLKELNKKIEISQRFIAKIKDKIGI